MYYVPGKTDEKSGGGRLSHKYEEGNLVSLGNLGEPRRGHLRELSKPERQIPHDLSNMYSL